MERAKCYATSTVMVELFKGRLEMTTNCRDFFEYNQFCGMLVLHVDAAKTTMQQKSWIKNLFRNSRNKFHFGFISGRTTGGNSIFQYHNGKSHADYQADSFYRPIFLDELRQNFTDEEWNEMNKTCKGNTQCLFDLAVTGTVTLCRGY